MSDIEFPDGKIRFEIEALGPIRDSTVDFKPFLLFSGESNTGKSYMALAVYYLFFMLDNEKIIEELTSKLFDIKKIENDLKTKKEVELKLSTAMMDELQRLYNDNINRFMAYMLGYDNFSCKVKLTLEIPQISGSKIYISLKKVKDGKYFLEEELDSPIYNWNLSLPLNVNSKKFDIDIKDDFKYFVRGLCIRIIFDKSYHNRFLLPPARGAFSGLTSSMWKKFSGIGMYNEFLEGIDSVRFSNFETYDEIEEQKKIVIPLLEKLLNGKIKVETDNVTYMIAGSDHEIPLTAGSSSVKELFPLYLLLNRVLIDRISICIEEPEAHLHPELQRSVAMLLSYIINQDGFVQVTTHSDFFVNQVNNLLKLHFIKNKEPDRFLEALKETGIREEFVLDPEDVGAYYFEKVKADVYARKLVASENGMPMESFKHTYDQSGKETRYLREVLTDHEE
jgi:predicted ATPase